MSKTKFALGTLIGAVAGVVAGILTAPKSGKETRADIKAKASELKDEAVEKKDAAKDKVVHTAEDVKAKIDEGRAIFTGDSNKDKNKK